MTKMSRRQFLWASAIILGGAELSRAGREWFRLGDTAVAATSSLANRIITVRSTGLFDGLRGDLTRRLFGLNQYLAPAMTTIPGLWHPEWGDKGHPADRLAEAFAAQVVDTKGIMSSVGFSPDARSAIPASMDGDIAVFGSPVSNEVSAILFDYDGVDPYHLERREDAVFPQLKWAFLADAAQAPARLWAFGTGQPHYGTPNWQVKVLPEGTSRGSAVAGERAVDDYLVITRLRNFLTPESFNARRSIVIVGGAHGLGTVGFGRLMKETDEFRRLLDEAGDGEFQALLKVSEPDSLSWPGLEPKSADWLYDVFPSSIQVMEVERLTIPDSMYQERARPRVVPRLENYFRKHSQPNPLHMA